jgi:hypothetical protein
MIERWATIAEFPDYEISTSGRCRRWDSTKKEFYIKKPNKHKQGYWLYSFHANGKGYGRSAHRLVALAFLPNPNNYPNVCHRDGNPENAQVGNLRWGDQPSNLRDALEHGTGLYGENAHFAVLTLEEVRKIRHLYFEVYKEKHGAMKKVADEVGHPYNRVRDVIVGNTWADSH